MKFKSVRCKSGIMGWQGRLQNVYFDFNDFCHYDELAGVSKRLGYKNARAAWAANPIMRASVIPSDMERVKDKKKNK